jgi:hypothetical protein
MQQTACSLKVNYQVAAIELSGSYNSIIKNILFFDNLLKLLSKTFHFLIIQFKLRETQCFKYGGKMDNKNIVDTKISSRVTSRKKGVVVYSKNPFWQPYQVKVGKKKITIAGGLLTNHESGEAIHHAGIHRVELVDETKFVKIFTQNLKVFFDLGLASQKVLQCLLATLQENKNADGIHLPWFTVEDHSKAHNLKISRTTFHRGLREMLKKGFIAESEHPNFYWINPNLFFNGDRMTFISEYRKVPIKANSKNDTTLDWVDDLNNQPKQESEGL